MLDACQEALDFVRGKSRTDLDTNRQLALSLVKEIEIIGEAASQVSDKFRADHNGIPWGSIIATRHRLIHGYFDIDLDIVWVTVERDLPALRKALKSILEAY